MYCRILCLLLLVGCTDPKPFIDAARERYGLKTPVLNYDVKTDTVQIGDYYLTGQTMRRFVYAETKIYKANSIDHTISKEVCVYAYFSPENQPVNNTIVQGGAGGGFISGGGDATANISDGNIRLCVYYAPYQVDVLIKQKLGCTWESIYFQEHVTYANQVQAFLCKAYTMATRREEL